jgi:hypothetical protein
VDCCHRSDNPSPAKRKKSSENASCCPLDATLIHKRDAPKLTVAASVGILFFDFHCMFHQVSRRSECPQTICQSGRDTLLETHLLRI